MTTRTIDTSSRSPACVYCAECGRCKTCDPGVPIEYPATHADGKVVLVAGEVVLLKGRMHQCAKYL